MTDCAAISNKTSPIYQYLNLGKWSSSLKLQTDGAQITEKDLTCDKKVSCFFLDLVCWWNVVIMNRATCTALNTSWVSSTTHPSGFYPRHWLLHQGYMRTFARVSGKRSPTRPPPTSTDEARRMGMALVMPTREPKIRFPSTAASLHRALQNPKPVPLRKH